MTVQKLTEVNQVTLERLDLFDPEHHSYALLVSGRSGSGKTMSATVRGERLFVIDRAGHYELLTRLLPGAQQIELGAEGSPYALNPWDVADPARVSRQTARVRAASAPADRGGVL